MEATCDTTTYRCGPHNTWTMGPTDDPHTACDVQSVQAVCRASKKVGCVRNKETGVVTCFDSSGSLPATIDGPLELVCITVSWKKECKEAALIVKSPDYSPEICNTPDQTMAPRCTHKEAMENYPVCCANGGYKTNPSPCDDRKNSSLNTKRGGV